MEWLNWIESKAFVLWDSLPEISRVGLIIFLACITGIVFASNTTLDVKGNVQRAMDFFRKKIDKQDAGYWVAKDCFMSLCMDIACIVIGAIGFILFLIGFFI